MKKLIKSVVLFITFILMFNHSNAQSKYILNCQYLLIESSHKICLNEIGTLELTNNNDGDVEKYLSIFGLKSGSPYCAAGQYYCFLEGAKKNNIDINSIPIIKTALAQSIFNNAKKCGKKSKYAAKKHDLIVWKRGNSSKGHIERVHKVLSNGWVITIGFNTSKIVNGKKLEGVFLQKRNIEHPLGRLQIKGLVGFDYD